MKDNEYKKTYKPFILWIILFTLMLILISFLTDFSNLSETYAVKIIMFFTVLGLDALFYLIYNGEYVYWINGGPTYEQAKNAESSRRKKYAGAHFIIFTKLLIFTSVYLLVSAILSFNIWADILIITALIIYSAFHTIKIKF